MPFSEVDEDFQPVPWTSAISPGVQAQGGEVYGMPVAATGDNKVVYYPKSSDQPGAFPAHESGSSDQKAMRNVVVRCISSPATWADSRGHDCYTYEQNRWCTTYGAPGIGWQSSWGKLTDFVPFTGISATAACCACGGGMATLQNEKVTTPP